MTFEPCEPRLCKQCQVTPLKAGKVITPPPRTTHPPPGAGCTPDIGVEQAKEPREEADQQPEIRRDALYLSNGDIIEVAAGEHPNDT